jgi:hypothetical protein
VVRKQTKRNFTAVVKSFRWLDEALINYPQATLQPIPVSTPRRSILVAGGGLNESTAYPVAVVEQPPPENNLARMSDIFQDVLRWYPGQFDKWLDHHGPALVQFLSHYPLDLLEERLRFLLSPLPAASVLKQVNVTDDVDWPTIFYRQQRGAGMSVAQVSHALQTLPGEPLLLRLNPLMYDSIHADANQLNAVRFLYDQTPSIVLEMVSSVLELWVTGIANLDTVMLAYLHWRGWEWTICRVVLHALPNILHCNLEPGWELYERGSVVRNQLIPEALWYLQTRLHLRPWHVHSMLKTHSRLTGYSAVLLKRNLDFLQERLGLRSSELQALVLLMPSLLGASVEGLESRISFWTISVGLAVSQLRQAVARKPALLQYSVDKNLEPKLAFFTEELRIEEPALVRMTAVNPELWGRSLDRYLRPTATAFCDFCGNMSLPEYGDIVVKAPDLLRYSWIWNLKQKLDFLQNRLSLSDHELKTMVQATPRILTHSLKASLRPKIEYLESIDEHEGRKSIRKNPALLLSSEETLKERVERAGLDNLRSKKSLGDALTKRRRKTIWLVSEQEGGVSVEKEFAGAPEAARHAQTSTSNLYNAVRQGRLLKGRKYVYANETTIRPPAPSAVKRSIVTDDAMHLLLQRDIRQRHDLTSDPHTAHLTIHVAGRAYPPEDRVRGRRRTGGMALHVLSWSASEWKHTCMTLWRRLKYRLLPDGTLVLGYPYTRPSRPRCSLYICREALRVASNWLATDPTALAAASVVITVVSDSNYAVELLQNSSEVLQWGSAPTREKFVYTGPSELHKANPDILYPLSRTFYHLVEQDDDKSAALRRRNVTIHFVRAERSDPNFRRLSDGATMAAKLMYESVR